MKIDPRVMEIVSKIAGDNLSKVLEDAELLVMMEGKTPERALADVLLDKRV